MFLLPILLAFRAAEGDADIVVRLQRREPQALADLYDRYGRVAYSLILAVARNRAIDYLRSTGGRERHAVEFAETDRPSLYTGMDLGILASDKARAIGAAVEKLSAHQRQAIELAYFEGLSQTEIAERMGQPLGTVKTWVREALKNLRDEVGARAVSA
jgi:RNA polymerase sigma-70 factor (ECF subfamily)